MQASGKITKNMEMNSRVTEFNITFKLQLYFSCNPLFLHHYVKVMKTDKVRKLLQC